MLVGEQIIAAIPSARLRPIKPQQDSKTRRHFISRTRKAAEQSPIYLNESGKRWQLKHEEDKCSIVRETSGSSRQTRQDAGIERLIVLAV